VRFCDAEGDGRCVSRCCRSETNRWAAFVCGKVPENDGIRREGFVSDRSVRHTTDDGGAAGIGHGCRYGWAIHFPLHGSCVERCAFFRASGVRTVPE